MNGMIINPGTGPVEGATEEDAAINIAAFVQDLGREGVTVIREEAGDYGKGRFAFRLAEADPLPRARS